VVAGLFQAGRNSDQGQERATLWAMGALVGLYALMFSVVGGYSGATAVAMFLLFAMGLANSYIVAGNSIILQTRTPEHMRSRVLGNNFMLARAAGAFSVLCVGLLADKLGLEAAMFAAALFVALTLPLALVRARQNGR
jgi:predicted MFS family arabinose efflux permease